MALWGYKCTGLVPRFHPLGEGLVTFGQLLNVDCFLGRIFHPPITLQKTQSVSATPEILGCFRTMTQHLFGTGGETGVWAATEVGTCLKLHIQCCQVLNSSGTMYKHLTKIGCFPSLFFPLSVEYQSRIFANEYLVIHLKGVTTL